MSSPPRAEREVTPRSSAGIAGVKRSLPIGAEVVRGGVHFRVWAPKCSSLNVEFEGAGPRLEPVRLLPDGNGYFSGLEAKAEPGMRYRFRTAEGAFPDPASRFQPEGPHGPSEIVDPGSYPWRDEAWRGLEPESQVIYELHVGTFTKEGTWEAAARQLPELAALGISVLEIMPVADFPGRFGWGYDGVSLFAPTRLYGRPDDFRRFVDQAHANGLGVILDVVYNHVGPDGNYLARFSGDFFTDRYRCEWGQAINFDGPNSSPVREFFTANAAYWISEFHLDGLRLDATQQIFDGSPNHVLGVIRRKVRDAAPGRTTFVVGENEPQQTRLLRPFTGGGYELDALWNDDFHHSARVALTGKTEAYYHDYRGAAAEFVAAVRHGYLYQGQYYSWQKAKRGAPTRGLEPWQFITFLENHDQVANSLRGWRLHRLSHPGAHRALTALLLLGPGTPMLFQGQEFASSAPFVYFADHEPELAKLVRRGRTEFISQFPSIAQAAHWIPDPSDPAVFQSCKLDFGERERHAWAYALHRDLLQLRRTDPVLSRRPAPASDAAVLSDAAFAVRYSGGAVGERLLVVNLGRDLILRAAPEPLLAPLEGSSWNLVWSSEDPRYGGSGTPALELEGEWRLPGYSALLLGCELMERG